ncbi:signal peptidase II [Trueperella pyogenes]|uniref:Lipoprotein signal peptidase n=1 Tax=Trueperella pyogenes TaxID=1661 RepID=A0A3S9QJB3_9ACTO|nr:signal peptidase II [Trueperella pyogenes]AWG04816.1 signal peptidase II [Trueperella pyogenes]AWG15642.1 signal peptidase II [Trueperella pyogenes]AZR04528.1 signal peptidase II [Trueperella pyogenes]AZR05903.1 signal peptidase II [Trueperella pyogenes]MCI7688903.1 signal peptidase II [Trueperella pyogenes]
MKRILPFLLGLITIVLDQTTKQWALGALEGRRVSLIGDFLSLRLTFNSGAAFSLGASMTWVITLVAVVVSVGLPFLIVRSQRVPAIVLGFIWGGAVGNLLDRLFREPGFPQGHVVDMIDYNGWFIGNVADIALVGGVVALLVYEFFFHDSAERPE